METELISIREFGRRVELSDTMIKNYINAGKIGPDAIHKNKKNGRPELDFIVALQYWAIYNEIHELQYIIDNPDVLKLIEIDSKPAEATTQKEKPAKAKKEKKEISSEQLSILESDKRLSSAKAQLAEVNLEKALGNLVSINDVKKALYNFGAQIRIALEAIPDRSIDNIFAAKDRSEAHFILTNEIKRALLDLTDVDNKLYIKPKE
jgi:hypothetical protein